MTIQNLFVAELADIQNIQLKCKCGTQLSYEPDNPIRIPLDCPQCGARWNDPNVRSIEREVIESFMEIVKQAREQERREGVHLKVQLVFELTTSTQE